MKDIEVGLRLKPLVRFSTPRGQHRYAGGYQALAHLTCSPSPTPDSLFAKASPAIDGVFARIRIQKLDHRRAVGLVRG